MKRILSLLLCVAALPLSAANLCVGPSATGSGSGADWNNLKAWSGTPARGDTWYLVSGTYAAKTLSTANSGTTAITIKKATVADHGGVETGWTSSLDSGWANIASLYITTSYWSVDGNRGLGFSTAPPDATPASYGINITDRYSDVVIGKNTTDISLQRIVAITDTNSAATAGGGYFCHNENVSGTISNLTIGYCLLVGWGQALRIGESSGQHAYGITWDHNVYLWNFTSQNDPPPSGVHGNAINAMWANIYNLTVRYSLFAYTYGDGGTSETISGNGGKIIGAKIYGNVFDQNWTGRRIIGGNCVNGGSTVQDSYVYNNTFLMSEYGRPQAGGGIVGDECGSGNVAKNNLAYYCNASIGPSVTTHDYNEFIFTSNTPSEANRTVITANYDPFSSYAGNDYTLKSNTIAGATLSSEYATDALGNNRATWTRGAFEFGGTSTPSTNPAIYVTPSQINYGFVLSGNTSNQTVTVQNTGAGTLAGTASTSAPWSITGTATYSLTSNQTANITVTYSPTAAGSQSGSVAFTGASGASVGTTGYGYTNQVGFSWVARGGTVLAPMAVTNNYVMADSNNDAPGDGSAMFGFAVSSNGYYYFKVNCRGDGGSANSFYVGVDTYPVSEADTWDIVSLTTGFEDRYISRRGTGAFDAPQSPTNFVYLTTGNHFIYFGNRERYTAISNLTVLALTTNEPAAPPVILQQPSGLRLTNLQSGAMSVNATGDNIVYQWRHAGTNLPGEDVETLSITSATQSDAGDYSVVVTNSSGSATSVTASVEVVYPPQVLLTPAATNISLGASLVLTGAISGVSEITWVAGGNPIGVGSAISVQPSAGISWFSIRGANEVGEVESAPVKVFVYQSQVATAGRITAGSVTQ